jgi:hypothetical protein
VSFDVRREDAGGGLRRATSGTPHVDDGHVSAAPSKGVGDRRADDTGTDDENLQENTFER